MANRIGMIVFPLLVTCGGVVWLLGTGDRRATATTESETTPAIVAPVVAPPPLRAAAGRSPEQRPPQTAEAETPTAPPPPPVPTAAESNAGPADTEFRYTARRGDTVTRLAEAFLGGSTKAHQDAIVDANPSLRLRPDHLQVGKAYRIVAPDGLSAVAPKFAVQSLPPSAFQPDADDVLADAAGRYLTYTAREGDTVTHLALSLLGRDTKANRDSILNTNPALKTHPDRIVVGETYWISAPDAATPHAE